MKAKLEDVIFRLHELNDPILDYKIKKDLQIHVLDETEEKKMLTKIKSSAKVKSLLSEVDPTGIIPCDPYSKWFGTHWVLTTLAEIGYPQKDKSISGLIDQAYAWLSGFRNSWKVVNGKIRTHPCIFGNAVYYISKLGFIDERINNLIGMIMETRWQDGGWNCDRKPEARISSLSPTRLVLRGLNEFNRQAGNREIKKMIDDAVPLLTDREIFLTKKTKKLIHPSMAELSYPAFFHYNSLSALKTLADIGFKNTGCLDRALDSIEEKELKTGGFPSEKKRYSFSQNHKTRSMLAEWGPTGKTRMNGYVTVEVLSILKHYKRI
jgi:hypothetical protein